MVKSNVAEITIIAEGELTCETGGCAILLAYSENGVVTSDMQVKAVNDRFDGLITGAEVTFVLKCFDTYAGDVNAMCPGCYDAGVETLSIAIKNTAGGVITLVNEGETFAITGRYVNPSGSAAGKIIYLFQCDDTNGSNPVEQTSGLTDSNGDYSISMVAENVTVDTPIYLQTSTTSPPS